MAPGCTAPIFSEYKPTDPVGFQWLNLLEHICARSGHEIRAWGNRCRLEYSCCACGKRSG